MQLICAQEVIICLCIAESSFSWVTLQDCYLQPGGESLEKNPSVRALLLNDAGKATLPCTLKPSMLDPVKTPPVLGVILPVLSGYRYPLNPPPFAHFAAVDVSEK